MENRQRPQYVHAQLVIDLSDDSGRGERTIVEWFETGWRQLGGRLREMTEAQAAGMFVPVNETGPFGVDAWFERVPHGDRDGASDPYSAQEWRRFLDHLRQGDDMAYAFSINELAWNDSLGRPFAVGNDGYPRTFTIECIRYEVDGRRFALLGLDARRDQLLGSSEQEDALGAFFRQAAEQAGPLFGQIGFDYGIWCMTGLEYRLYLNPWQTLRKVEQVLRGYSWVTVLPDVMVDRLGGEQQLADTGVFVAAERLFAGGWWLQAAASAADYTQAHAKRVFRALRPVLPEKAYPSTFENDWRQY